MPSTLAWLDHDSAARDRTRRILALFQEKGTRDQLGLGSIRDAFADLLFPGTSTIQTRLRYFLLVPWMYRRMEEDEVPANRFSAEARRREVELIGPLLESDEQGVFGRAAGGDVKRLPSNVYWGGVGSWGIRRFNASQEQYHRAVDEIYRRRRAARRASSEEGGNGAGVITWHPELPPEPPSLAESATFALGREEAEFLRGRIVAEHRSSLLAWLALRSVRTEVPFPWEHPLVEQMSPEHRLLLDHARVFGSVMRGAAILFNRMVSELADMSDAVERHAESFEEWVEELDRGEVAAWSVSDLFAIARGHGGYRIGPQTEDFVRRWVALVRDDPRAIPGRKAARRLVRNREMLLKGARSLLRNQKAREENYGGELGLRRLNFRWINVQTLLNDLHDGLAGG